MVHSTFQARRALKIGDSVRQPGQLVPEAQTWFRVDHLVHSGQLTRVVVEDEQFDQAVEEFCPDLIEVLYPKENDMEDNAAKKAEFIQAERIKNPQTLSQQLAAPANTEDASVNDEVAATALAVDNEGDDKVEIEGAHEEFVSDAAKEAQASADEEAEAQDEPGQVVGVTRVTETEDTKDESKAAKKASAKKK
jgi:hypothetical protein